MEMKKIFLTGAIIPEAINFSKTHTCLSRPVSSCPQLPPSMPSPNGKEERRLSEWTNSHQHTSHCKPGWCEPALPQHTNPILLLRGHPIGWIPALESLAHFWNPQLWGGWLGGQEPNPDKVSVSHSLIHWVWVTELCLVCACSYQPLKDRYVSC